MVSLMAQAGRASTCSTGDAGLIPGSGRSTGERHASFVGMHPVILPGKSHGQRSLVGYSPWGHKNVRHDRSI